MDPVSVRDRRQVSADGLIIKTKGYQGRLADDSEPLAQAPAKQISIARWHKKAQAGELGRSTNQCLQIIIGLGDGVVRPADPGGIAGDSAQAFNNVGRSLADRVNKLAYTIVTVDTVAKSVAGG